MGHLLYPAVPDGVSNSASENLRGIYVRFEDHSIDSTALVEVKEMVKELERISDERIEQGSPGLFAHMVEPWVARQLIAHANCTVWYVYRTPNDNNVADIKYSMNYAIKRTAGE